MSLIGEVHDGESDESLAFAVIRIMPGEIITTTDKNGVYSFTRLCPGDYEIEVSYLGYKKFTQKLTLSKSKHIDVHLHEESCDLESVSIVHERPSTYTFESLMLEKEELDALKGKTLGDMLQNLPGVQAIKSGPTIFKPIVQGQYGNRVMILQDGLRLEGQQWGNDHAPEIDPDQSESIEVVKGAAALRYGSEAMGGVVLVSSEKPRTSPGLSGELSSGFFSNGRGIHGGLSLNGSSNLVKGLGVALRMSGKRHGNIKTPNYFLSNTGAEELNYSTSIQYHKKNYNLIFNHSSFNTTIGIFQGAHIGNIIDLANALNRGQPNTPNEFSYTINRSFQQVNHKTYQLKLDGINTKWGRPTLMLSLQQNQRSEYDVHRPKGDNSNTPTVNYDLLTWNGELAFEHKPIRQWAGVLGYAFMQQSNISSTTNIRLFVPNFFSTTHGFFWIESFRFNRFLLEVGSRLEIREYQIFKFVGNDKISPQRTYFSNSFSGGISYFLSEKWQLKHNYSWVERMPAINEMFSDGLHHAEGVFVVANPSQNFHFNNERMLNIVASVEHQTENKKINLGAFFSQINNYVILQPKGVVTGIRGAYPAFEYIQTDVNFLGIDGSIQQKILKNWEINAHGNLVYAEDTERNNHFIGIPPSRINLKINHWLKNTEKQKLSFFIGALSVFRQRFFPKNKISIAFQDVTGNQEINFEGDFLPAPNSYLLFQAGAVAKFNFKKQPIEFFCTVENLANTAYRDYLNRMRYYADEPGRNIRIRFVLPF